MKRILSFVLVLCVAATLFAATGLSVKASGAFDIFSLRTSTISNTDAYYTFKGNGLGFELGVQYDINDKILVYADYSMVFPSDFQMEASEKPYASGKYSELVEDAKLLAEMLTDGKATNSLFFLNISAGAAYKFDFDPIKLAVGGGAYYNLLYGRIRVTGSEFGTIIDNKDIVSFYTIGLSALVDAKYMVAKNIGICLTVIPQIGFFSERSFTFYENGEKMDTSTSLSGFGVSFSMPISIGASYSF